MTGRRRFVPARLRRTPNSAVRTAVSRIGVPLALGVLPAAVLILMFVVAVTSDSLAVDFRNEIYAQAKNILSGTNPYPSSASEIRGSNHVWPPLVAILAVPLTVLDATAAGVVVVVVSLAAFAAALWIVEVRDWRVYGSSALWAPVATDMRTAHLTLVLCLLVAVAWRFRDRTASPGLAVGVAVALKFLLWPLILWLASIGKPREAVIATTSAAASLLLLLPFIGVFEYIRLLRRVGAAFDQDSFTPFGLLVQAGAPETAARIAALAIGAGILCFAWRRRSFTLFTVGALALSPIVWLDYFAFIAIPLAASRPTFGAVWLLPILTWGIAGAGAGAGDTAATLRVLVVFTVVVWCSVRAERSDQPAPRATTREAIP